MNLPKISCLTVTLDRLISLKEAIRCYCGQTYPNREMVIVTEGTKRFKQAIQDYLKRLDRSDIRLVTLEGSDFNLGKVRNIALESAHGDVIVQWDDDDLYHPNRLQTQMNHLLKEQAGACLMTDQLQYFWGTRELYWVNWDSQATGDLHHLIPGTVMLFKDSRFRYPESGPYARAGEDSVFLEQVYQTVKTVPLRSAGHLYVYSYHGRNTFDAEHHRKIQQVYGTEATYAWQRESQLRYALPYYRLPYPSVLKDRNDQTIFTF